MSLMNLTRKKHFRRDVAVIKNIEDIERKSELRVYKLLRYSMTPWILASLPRAHISFFQQLPSNDSSHHMLIANCRLAS
jgi:hypothetical protein